MRRLRVLHPLSFVEDPTRVFRAARYAVRLGLTLDPWTAACRRLALGRAPFDALSGARLTAELLRILEEPHAERVLARLAMDGAFRLIARGYRYGVPTGVRLGALARRTAGLGVTRARGPLSFSCSRSSASRGRR
jgi:tRNA nucleotidyltransferase/poly(A) polymerase